MLRTSPPAFHGFEEERGGAGIDASPLVTKTGSLVHVFRLIQAFGGAEHAGMEGKAFCSYRLTRGNAARNGRLRSGLWFSRLEMSV